MIYSEASKGRVFVIRLEDGDIIHEKIEALAIQHNIKCASLITLGGVDKGSILITGPENGRAEKIVPTETILEEAYEVTGTGTIFPDKNGIPRLHMHISCGRKGKSITGCIRRGVKVWLVLEVILSELTDCSAGRLPDEASGFDLLIP